MGTASEIRKNLQACGRCINCKLVIWDKKAELKPAQNIIKFKSTDETLFYYMVRCSWLKTPILEPEQLIVCEGRQEQK